jgi:uncharacterized protein YodC (DUF2158 family)
MFNEMKNEVFFSPGDVVTLKQSIPHKPKMIVKSVDRVSETHEKPRLIGITCQWFTPDLMLQTARFSTKDLIHVEGD